MANVQRLTVIKGAGDIATGVAHRLWQSGFAVVMLEQPQPTDIRRTVAFAEAIYEGRMEVEGVAARLVSSPAEAFSCLARGEIPVLIDPSGACICQLKPLVLVDATLAKQNLGTSRDQAGIVVGVGPGFTVGVDVHAVVESLRGHNLGRVYLTGQAAADTGLPGDVGGYTNERVLRAPAAGLFKPLSSIGDLVGAGQTVAVVDGLPVQAQIAGVLRGLLREGLHVYPGMKVGDVDPRAIPEHCHTISDKARAVAGGVLEAVMYLLQGPGAV